MRVKVEDKGLISITGLSYAHFYILCACLARTTLNLAAHVRWNVEKKTVVLEMLTWDQVTMISAIAVDQLKLLNDIVEGIDYAMETAIKK